MLRRAVVLGCALAGLAGLPASAAAQSIGFGPRFAFVRCDLALDTPATTFFGGTVRYRVTPRISLEVAADYRKYRGPLAGFRETPLQGSVLMAIPLSIPRVRPYGVAGMGFYRRITDVFDANGLLFASTKEGKAGWHLGVGADVPVYRHTVAFADVRFRSVQFGTPDSVLSGLSDVTLSRGSMVTSGVAFYF